MFSFALEAILNACPVLLYASQFCILFLDDPLVKKTPLPELEFASQFVIMLSNELTNPIPVLVELFAITLLIALSFELNILRPIPDIECASTSLMVIISLVDSSIPLLLFDLEMIEDRSTLSLAESIRIPSVRLTVMLLLLMSLFADPTKWMPLLKKLTLQLVIDVLVTDDLIPSLEEFAFIPVMSYPEQSKTLLAVRITIPSPTQYCTLPIKVVVLLRLIPHQAFALNCDDWFLFVFPLVSLAIKEML